MKRRRFIQSTAHTNDYKNFLPEKCGMLLQRPKSGSKVFSADCKPNRIPAVYRFNLHEIEASFFSRTGKLTEPVSLGSPKRPKRICWI